MTIEHQPILTETGDPYPDIPRLRKAVEWVETQALLPEREREWEQSYWRTPASELSRDCGTCYCVAGKVVQDVGLEWRGSSRVITEAGHFESVQTAAEHILGISRAEGLGLFNGDNTAGQVRLAAESIAARIGERL